MTDEELSSRRLKKAEYQRRYRENPENREKCKVACAKWNAENPDYGKEYRAANPRQARDRELQKKYGITFDQYDAMLSEQNNTCAICETRDPKASGTFHVDHCHTTKKVRALLCHHCNVGLGHFADNAERLLKAASYIRQHTEAA